MYVSIYRIWLDKQENENRNANFVEPWCSAAGVFLWYQECRVSSLCFCWAVSPQSALAYTPHTSVKEVVLAGIFTWLCPISLPPSTVRIKYTFLQQKCNNSSCTSSLFGPYCFCADVTRILAVGPLSVCFIINEWEWGNSTIQHVSYIQGKAMATGKASWHKKHCQLHQNTNAEDSLNTYSQLRETHNIPDCLPLDPTVLNCCQCGVAIFKLINLSDKDGAFPRYSVCM